MDGTNIKLTQMDIIRQVLDVSDINLLVRIKTFLANNKNSSMANAKQNHITEELQKDIDEAREEYKRGDTLHFENATDAKKWMEAL